MKKIIYTLVILGTILFSGCGSSSKEESSPALLKALAGEWHLTAWVGEKPSGFDTYLQFNTDKTFVVYQQVEEVYYQKYTGNFLLKGTNISGKYSDNTTWGSAYEISLDETGNTLTMKSDSAGETNIYTRSAIPESVKAGAKAAQASRSVNRPL